MGGGGVAPAPSSEEELVNHIDFKDVLVIGR